MKTNALSFLVIAICLSLFSCNSGEKKNHLVLTMADNSRVSVDWEGTYSGTIPCADCEGIFIVITLNNNATYEMTMNYLGKDFEVTSEGNFSWNEQGSIITLDIEGEGMKMFKVGENRIFMLDIHGNEITGELADNYILEKVD
ncbi:MAG: copper resistance protein NlpE [Bacteroidetes bacterium]|nr:copper resistance protein NlpE [Bacteroidota bacterium]MCL2303274.1 copper resistance protein NlpE [Lentimicrobiaceae bacterium]